MENESTFVAPEGVYSLTEDHKPVPVTHNAPGPLFPTRLSTTLVRFPPAKPAPSPGLTQLLGGSKDFWKDRAPPHKDDAASVSSSDSPDDGTSPDPSNAQDSVPPTPVASHDQHHGLFAHHPAPKKKSASRPKHNMRTTSSTFITRLHSLEGLSRTLQAKQGDVTFLFYNSAKNFYWLETGLKSKVRRAASSSAPQPRLTFSTSAQDPLTRISFSAYPTCHDVNQATVSHEHIDVIIGFNTGDLVWFGEPNPSPPPQPRSRSSLRPRPHRLALRPPQQTGAPPSPLTAPVPVPLTPLLPLQGRISKSPCTAVRWVPSSPNLFLVSHADGTIIVYDKDRDDGLFAPQHPHSGLPQPPSARPAAAAAGEWNPLDTIFVTMPPWHPVNGGPGAAGGGGRGERDKAAKNPVSHWKVAHRSIVGACSCPSSDVACAMRRRRWLLGP